jgi:hypothetical protein
MKERNANKIQVANITFLHTVGGMYQIKQN